jgi:putative ABC transport system permease protein
MRLCTSFSGTTICNAHTSKEDFSYVLGGNGGCHGKHTGCRRLTGAPGGLDRHEEEQRIELRRACPHPSRKKRWNQTCGRLNVLALTFADLYYRSRQFLIAVVGAGLVLAMGLLLAGLVGGFSAELSQTVAGTGADQWVLSNNAGGRIASTAVFPESAVTTLAHTAGVSKAAPFVLVPQQVAEVNGQPVTVVLTGVKPGDLGDPVPSAGHPLTSDGQVVVDSGVGAPIGSHIRMGSHTLEVVGQTDGRTLFGGVPLIYLTLHDAQTLALGGQPLVTAVLLSGHPAQVPRGLTVYAQNDVEQRSLKSMAAAVSSINNSKLLMWAVAAIIIAALLYVSALQRVRDFAVLKALGASSAALFGSLATQAVAVTLAAALFGLIISNFMGGMFQLPLSIPPSAYAYLPVVAVVVGLLSSLVALRRVTGADPAAAFG